MKYIELILMLDDDLRLKSITFGLNDTGLNEDTKLLKNIATAILVSISENSRDLELQDILNNNDIRKNG